MRLGRRRTDVEEHDGTWIVELVHAIEIRYESGIDEVDDGKVAHLLTDAIERFVHLSADGIVIMAEANDDDAILFG